MKLYQWKMDENPQGFAASSWKALDLYLKSSDLPWELKTAPAETVLADLFSEADTKGLRVSLQTGAAEIQNWPSRPTDVSQLQCFDHILKIGDQFWPRLLWPQVLQTRIIEKTKALDLRQSCYIVAEGPWLSICVWVAAQLGFSHLVLIGEDTAHLELASRQLKGSVIGLQVSHVQADQLTMQTWGCSVLFNALDLNQKQDLLGNLAYFNFMIEGGVVIDLPVGNENKTFLQEAESAELKILSPWELQAALDFELLNCILSKDDKPASFEKFLPLWKLGLPSSQHRP